MKTGEKPRNPLTVVIVVIVTSLLTMAVISLGIQITNFSPTETVPYTTDSTRIRYWHDDVRGVSCYTFTGDFRSSAISCVPD